MVDPDALFERQGASEFRGRRLPLTLLHKFGPQSFSEFALVHPTGQRACWADIKAWEVLTSTLSRA